MNANEGGGQQFRTIMQREAVRGTEGNFVFILFHIILSYFYSSYLILGGTEGNTVTESLYKLFHLCVLLIYLEYNRLYLNVCVDTKYCGCVRERERVCVCVCV